MKAGTQGAFRGRQRPRKRSGWTACAHSYNDSLFSRESGLGILADAFRRHLEKQTQRRGVRAPSPSEVEKRAELSHERTRNHQGRAIHAPQALFSRKSHYHGVKRHSDNPESSHPTSTYTAAEELQPTFALAFAKDTTGFVTTLQATYTPVPRKETPRSLALQVRPVGRSLQLI